MAVNQSPLYHKAEERYRAAATPAERAAAIEEMLRLVPKHKASEKLQAALKQKLKAAREEQQKSASKGGGSHPDLFHVPRQGAGQVVLIGAANTGKSAIVQALTNAKVEVADFPFSTHSAVPGMARHEDVPIQLVDMPPIVGGDMQPGMMNAYRPADAVLLVIDLSALDLIDQYQHPVELLSSRGLRLVSTPTLTFEDEAVAEDDDGSGGPHEHGSPSEGSTSLPKRCLVAANKCDTPGAEDNLAGLRELVECALAMFPVSATTGEGLAGMMGELFRLLNVIRVYAKKPGKPADRESPFILPVGGTVGDMAHLVHRDLAEKLKNARVWGGDTHDGQQVHATHVLTDKNVVELHF